MKAAAGTQAFTSGDEFGIAAQLCGRILDVARARTGLGNSGLPTEVKAFSVSSLSPSDFCE